MKTLSQTRAVRLSSGVLDFLDQHVESMRDTPDSILRRLLKLPPREEEAPHEKREPKRSPRASRSR